MSRTLSDEDVWEEVAKAADELYHDYVELNDLLSRSNEPAHRPAQLCDMERNWDVPTGFSMKTG